ncbi:MULTISPECIES: Gfo/Idh/MocA family protein [Hyphomicrobiales]|uniref:Gfo/Idh/MocA family protein n=1 Tax=Hyphomicrobiales TaxID=356 RepID=UPI001C0B4F67|nr:Gfo/Idh/MocA family oxidoreductase [Rhizobium sp. X9]MCH4541858.1 Gfo/Idh/MocA family oxidoreductase [Ochrobactrum sp. A-1]
MRLIILGTGWFANFHASQFSKIDGVDIVAAVDTNQAQLEAFAAKHEIPKTFSSLEDAIAWGQFDAATNVTPDRVHYLTTMQLLAAGKHVFCEKPLATNYANAREMADAAETSGKIAMVNLTYRNVAALQAASKILSQGKIGAIRHFEASYLQSWLVSKAWGDWSKETMWLWRLSTKHGSNGVLGDIGIHILDFVVFAIGSEVRAAASHLKVFDKIPGNQIGEYSLDANDSFLMMAELQNGATGVIHATRWATGHLNELRLRVHGDRGALEIVETPDGATLRICEGDDTDNAIWRPVEVEPVITNFQRFVNAVKSGKQDEPTFAHAAKLQLTLDHVVKHAGTLPAL